MLKKKKNIVDHGMIAGDWLLQNGFLFLPLELKKFDLNFDLFVCLFVVVKMKWYKGYQIGPYPLSEFVPFGVFLLPMNLLQN